MELKNREFSGIIKEGISTSDTEGKYLVFLLNLTPNDTSLKPIWARNEVQGSRFSRWVDINTKAIISSGSYYPLYPGMKVNVRFRTDALESCYITNVISDIPLIDKTSNRDNFYLINKTKKNSWIYQDDDRGITHIMHDGGSSNIVLEKEKIVLHTGQPIGDGIKGTLISNALEIGATGTKLEFGDNSIILDSTGITFKCGNNILTMTDNSTKILSSGSLDLVSEKNINFQGKNLFLTGLEEAHLYSNVTRLTGNTQLALSSNVVTIDGISSTFIKGGQVTIEGLLRTKIIGPTVELSSLTNMSISSMGALTMSSQATIISGASTVINGANIFMDGMIVHGMSAAASISASMIAMNLGLNTGMDVANAALVTSLGFSDPFSATTNSIITSTATGVARPVGEILRHVAVPADAGAGVSEKIAYVTSSDAIYNLLVKDYFVDLKHTYDIKTIGGYIP